MTLFLFWVVFAVACGFVAAGRGRSFVGYLVLALVFSPLFSGAVLLVLGDRSKASNSKPPAVASPSSTVSPTPPESDGVRPLVTLPPSSPSGALVPVAMAGAAAGVTVIHSLVFSGLGATPLVLSVMLAGVVGFFVSTTSSYASLTNREAFRRLRKDRLWLSVGGGLIAVAEVFALVSALPEQKLRNAVAAVLRMGDPCEVPSESLLLHATKSQRLALQQREGACQEQLREEKRRAREQYEADCSSLGRSLKKGRLSAGHERILREKGLTPSRLLARQFSPSDVLNFSRYDQVCSDVASLPTLSRSVAELLAEAPDAWVEVSTLADVDKSLRALLAPLTVRLRVLTRSSLALNIEAFASKGVVRRASDVRLQQAGKYCELGRLLRVESRSCEKFVTIEKEWKARKEAKRLKAEQRRARKVAAEEAREARCEDAKYNALDCSFSCMDKHDIFDTQGSERCERKCQSRLRAAGCAD